LLSGNTKKNISFSKEVTVDAADYGHPKNHVEHAILSPVPEVSYKDLSPIVGIPWYHIFISDVLFILQSPLSKRCSSDQDYENSIPMVKRTIDTAWPTPLNNRDGLSKGT